MTPASGTPSVDKPALARPRRSLFVKYFAILAVAVLTPLLLGAFFEGWFGYQDQRARLSIILRDQSRDVVNRVQQFTDALRDQVSFLVQSSSERGDDERDRSEIERMLRQTPAIMSVTLLDGVGQERMFISRSGVNRFRSRIDWSGDLPFRQARANRIWFSSVWYERDADPNLRIAIAGYSTSSGVAVADISLRPLLDEIAALKIGDTGRILLFDEYGQPIGRTDSRLVSQAAAPAWVSGLMAEVDAQHASAVVPVDDGKGSIVAGYAGAGNTGWTVVAYQTVAEAFGPIRAALWRSLGLIVVGTLLALGLAYWLAQRMSHPIRKLEEGVQRVGAGQFDHRITISSGDELEELANRFNAMAGELASSKEKSERILRLKRFLAPQVAEIVEQVDNQGLLNGQRRDIVVLFGDLRGFTAFSAQTDPETIMRVLTEYYQALGAVAAAHEATLTGFSGDGVMILLNAPVICDDPASRGIALASDLQAAVQRLVARWREEGHSIGFGVGLAMGQATVGTVGYDGRLEYTAIGRVVNLAARLCSDALNGQVLLNQTILLNQTVADTESASVRLEALGERTMKGFDTPVPVFSVVSNAEASITPSYATETLTA